MLIFIGGDGATLGSPITDPNAQNGKDVAPGTGAGQFYNQAWWQSAYPDGPAFDFSGGGAWYWDGGRKLPGLK